MENFDLLELSNFFESVSEDFRGFDRLDSFFRESYAGPRDFDSLLLTLTNLDLHHRQELDSAIDTWTMDTRIIAAELFASLHERSCRASCLLRFANASVQIPLLLGYDPRKQRPPQYKMTLQCSSLGEAIRWALTEFWHLTNATIHNTYAAHLAEALA